MSRPKVSVGSAHECEVRRLTRAPQLLTVKSKWKFDAILKTCSKQALVRWGYLSIELCSILF